MRQNDTDDGAFFVLGITGGVGAGKSTVLSILQQDYGAHLILADEVGHMLRAPGMPIYCWMVNEYGNGILNSDGTINPPAVAALVFGDAEKTRRLNEHTHPLIRQAIVQEIFSYKKEQQKRGERGFLVLESALMTEGGLLELCKEVWYISAPESVRIQRLTESRGYSKSRCEDIIRRQKDDAAFRREADFVIDNSKSREETKEQIAQGIKLRMNCAGVKR